MWKRARSVGAARAGGEGKRREGSEFVIAKACSEGKRGRVVRAQNGGWGVRLRGKIAGPLQTNCGGEGQARRR